MPPAPFLSRVLPRNTGFFLLATVVVLQLSAATPATSDLELGRQLFQNLCVTCHGFAGAGGDAPVLARAKLLRAPDDDALRALIAEGLPDRGMPRVRRLTENELRGLVTYVRSLGSVPPAPAPGNAPNGQQIYLRLGCAACHTINGQGGTIGPELTAIGRMRGAEYLRQSVVNPGAVLPRGTLPIPARGLSEYLPVVIVPREGPPVKGLRLNEDSFTIQVRNNMNSIQSFRKSDLERIEKQPGKSQMPVYTAQLKAAELNDLVAYLCSLGAAP